MRLASKPMLSRESGLKSSNPRWALVALRRAFVWKGRARRAEAWWYMAAYVLCTVPPLILSSVTDIFDPVGSIVRLAAGLLFVLGMLPGVACAIRRLHDLDRSGWWYWLVFATLPSAPFVAEKVWDSYSAAMLVLVVLIVMFSGALVLCYWFLQRGTIGDNRFGPDPLMQA